MKHSASEICYAFDFRILGNFEDPKGGHQDLSRGSGSLASEHVFSANVIKMLIGVPASTNYFATEHNVRRERVFLGQLDPVVL